MIGKISFLFTFIAKPSGTITWEKSGWEWNWQQKKTDLRDKETDSWFELLDPDMPKANIPWTFQFYEPIHFLVYLRWFMFSSTNKRSANHLQVIPMLILYHPPANSATWFCHLWSVSVAKVAHPKGAWVSHQAHSLVCVVSQLGSSHRLSDAHLSLWHF